MDLALNNLQMIDMPMFLGEESATYQGVVDLLPNLSL